MQSHSALPISHGISCTVSDYFELSRYCPECQDCLGLPSAWWHRAVSPSEAAFGVHPGAVTLTRQQPHLLTSGQTPWHLLLCVPQKCNAEHFPNVFFGKTNTIFTKLYTEMCGGVFPLEISSINQSQSDRVHDRKERGWLKGRVCTEKGRKQERLLCTVFFKPFGLWPTTRKMMCKTMWNEHLLSTRLSHPFSSISIFKMLANTVK